MLSKVSFSLLLCFLINSVYGKSDSLSKELEAELIILSKSSIPELNNKVELSVSGASLKEFIRALANISDLNVNISPLVQGTVSNNFKNETAQTESTPPLNTITAFFILLPKLFFLVCCTFTWFTDYCLTFNICRCKSFGHCQTNLFQIGRFL